MKTRMGNVMVGAMLMVLLTTGIGHADLSDGLVGYWSFDNASDLGHDDSGNGNHGTVYGAVSTTGMVGNAMSFDGNGDYVVVGDSDELDLTSSFTLSFWLNSGSSNESILLSKHVAHTDMDGSWMILHPASSDPWYQGRLAMHNWRASPDWISAGTQIQQGEWVHWAITYDASTNACTFYADGEVDATHTYTFDIRNISRPLTIGGAEHFEVPYVRYFYEGLMDEVRIYNRALSETEIHELSNSPPVANAGPDQTVEQTGVLGAEVQLDGSASSDPDGDSLTYDWTWSDSGPVSVSGPQPLITLPPGLTVVTLTVSDGVLSDADTVQMTVEDTTPPQIQVLAPEQYGLYPVGGITLSFSAMDCSGISQLWGTLSDAAEHDQEVSPGFAPGAGVYTLVVSVIDGVGNRADSEPILFVVYDASSGFVTGGGWINSPPGAHKANPSLTGKATFGFVSKYKRGANVPTGNTEFQFKAGNLNFHSSSYDWLVVTGSDYARFKGAGAINGFGDYKFMLWAGDDTPDTFRIKIWGEDGETENVVYDNGMNQPIGGGSIVVHAK